MELADHIGMECSNLSERAVVKPHLHAVRHHNGLGPETYVVKQGSEPLCALLHVDVRGRWRPFDKVSAPGTAGLDHSRTGGVNRGDEAGEHFSEETETSRPGRRCTEWVEDPRAAGNIPVFHRALDQAIGDKPIQVKASGVDVQPSRLGNLGHAQRTKTLSKTRQDICAPRTHRAVTGRVGQAHGHPRILAHIFLKTQVPSSKLSEVTRTDSRALRRELVDDLIRGDADVGRSTLTSTPRTRTSARTRTTPKNKHNTNPWQAGAGQR
jgi:hypothetical protein